MNHSIYRCAHAIELALKRVRSITGAGGVFGGRGRDDNVRRQQRPDGGDHSMVDVCLLLEGTWPYVRGGVSNWVDQLIRCLPELTFSVLFIGGRRTLHPQRQYQVPPNVRRIDEVFLEDATNETSKPRDQAGDVAALQALYRFLHDPAVPSAADGEALLDAFCAGRITRDQIFHSRASWSALTRGYLLHGSDPSFLDHFWTLRGIQTPLPLLARAAAALPRARVLHAVSTGYAGFVAALLKQRWHGTFLLSEHGIYTKERKIELAQAGWIKEAPEAQLDISLDADIGYARRLWTRFFERLGLLAYRSADLITTLYEGNRQRQIQDGAVSDRIRVIPNGIALTGWEGAAVSRPAGIPPVVGLIGRVVPIKDVKTFIRAMRGVIGAVPEAQGWIVGPEEEDPDYAAECRSLVASLGLEGKVCFLGFRRAREVMPQLGLMVLTSISEAQPLVILEAWAAGTPVVSSDVGSCRELIEGVAGVDRELGSAGAIVPIADPQATASAIVSLLGQPQRWRSAQAAGLERVRRHYTEELMLTRYRSLYAELGAGHIEPGSPPNAATGIHESGEMETGEIA